MNVGGHNVEKICDSNDFQFPQQQPNYAPANCKVAHSSVDWKKGRDAPAHPAPWTNLAARKNGQNCGAVAS